MNKELYVSTTPHETKVALVEDDLLAEVYFERENEYTLAGSIYKGRVTRVLPGMQSAFVDIGLDRDAFLYVSDFLELQDEDEDGEFGDVKVTGATLAQANGLILAEPLPAEEEDSVELEDELVAEGEDAQAGTQGDTQGETKDAGAPRWRGRRRRRGRRGGRERAPGDPVEAQPGSTDSEGSAVEPVNTADSSQPTSVQDSDVPAPREPRRRELRGFEPRGLVVHGLAHSVDQTEEPEPEIAAEPAAMPEEEKSTEPAAAAFTPMLLPGESISKYNRAEGEAPAPAPLADSSAPEDSDRGYGRSRDRGDRDRGGRGRRGDRDRDHGRGREREREPREYESPVLPENYTPILLPGESISKYRGVEPASASDTVEAALPAETMAPAHSEANTDQPLPSASYSGVSALPSLTQRRFVEEVAEESAEEAVEKAAVVKEEAAREAAIREAAIREAAALTQSEPAQPELTHHVAPEAVPDLPETATGETTSLPPAPQAVISQPAQPEVAPVEIAQPEELHPVQPHIEPAPREVEPAAYETHEAKIEVRGPSRPSWRDRVSKIFGGNHQQPSIHPETQAQPSEPAHSEAPAPVEPAAERQRPTAPALPAASRAEAPSAAKPPAPYESQYGSFVIEGGHVEHEEIDEEETEMPALAEHADRYEESEEEDEDGNGSQFGTAVRESGEENELEDEEYDFGTEEYEESELLAGQSVEEEEKEGGEKIAGGEPEVAAAPEAGRQHPERFDRRDRRGRRTAPPQRGGPRSRTRQHSRALPLISELLKEGQEILVQIAKEPIGKKGARITSHIALPGRFLVYMPTVNHIGVSRKISSEEERQRLKRIVSSERENGAGGFIVRTAAVNIKEDELRADIRFLKHLWTEIRTRAESSKSPSLIYHDLNLVERVLRDQVTSDFSQIWVDNESEYERVVRFASRFQPSLVRRIKLYTKDTPLYEQFGINEEINKSLKSKVWLKSGGYIVINQTEALVAIDINTGKYVGKTARLEDTIVKTNCDAVKEIVRQVRLRDLGGIIVVDFIDMDERKNRQKVMQALEEAMKSDRAPSKILQFNDFGLVAITRKRVKQSLERTLGTPCPYCDATGFVKSVQTVCNEIYVEMRKVRRHVESKEVILRVNPEVAKELKTGNGKWLQEMEELIGHPVLVKSDAQLHQEKFDMNY
jgi:ribonuclease G